MREIVFSGAGITSRRLLHDQLSQLLDFPEWYGRNLDALKDMLTDIGEDTCLVVTDCAALAEGLGTYYRSFQRVMKAASLENTHFTYRLEEGSMLPPKE